LGKSRKKWKQFLLGPGSLRFLLSSPKDKDTAHWRLVRNCKQLSEVAKRKEVWPAKQSTGWQRQSGACRTKANCIIMRRVFIIFNADNGISWSALAVGRWLKRHPHALNSIVVDGRECFGHVSHFAFAYATKVPPTAHLPGSMPINVTHIDTHPHCHTHHRPIAKGHSRTHSPDRRP